MRGHVVVNGTTVTFVPDIRLHYGTSYTFTLNGVLDAQSLVALPAQSYTFTTFSPVVLQRIPDIDARDVAWMDPNTFADGQFSPCTDMIAVAEGDATVLDSERGITFYDVTDLSSTPQRVSLAFKQTPASQPRQVTSIPTAGLDRAVKFAPGPAVTLTNHGSDPATTQSFGGPFLMSVDGGWGRCPVIGGHVTCPERFGMWRLFDLSQFSTVTPTITQIAARFVNHSPESLNRLAGTDDTQSPSPYDLEDLNRYVPNEVGVPADVASFGTQIAYVANLPFIGVEALVPNEMDPRTLVDVQVKGVFGSANGTQGGAVRAVAALTDATDGSKDLVLAVQEAGATDRLVLLSPSLTLQDQYPLGASALDLKGLKGWWARLDPSTQATVQRDLIVVSATEGLQILAVTPPGDIPPGGGPQTPATLDKTGAKLAPGLSAGIGKLNMPGHSPNGIAYDPETQLLFVADGTSGLSIIDLAIPGGSRHDYDGAVDDRVLGTVDFDGARAEAVTVWRDFVGALTVAVATGQSGVYLVDVSLPTVVPTTPQSALASIAAASFRTRPLAGGQAAGSHSCDLRFDFQADPGQQFGFDQAPQPDQPQYISLDWAAGSATTVQLKFANGFKPNTYWVASENPDLFDVEVVVGGSGKQLAAGQSTLKITAHGPPQPAPADHHLTGKISVRFGSATGSALAMQLNVELYPELVIPDMTVYRVVDANSSAAPPEPLSTFVDVDITGKLNDILKQAVVHVNHVSAGPDLPVSYDSNPQGNGNGFLDIGQEDQFIQLPSTSGVAVAYVSRIKDGGLEVAGITTDISFVTNMGGKFVQILAHELLHHYDYGRLCDLVDQNTSPPFSQARPFNQTDNLMIYALSHYSGAPLPRLSYRSQATYTTYSQLGPCNGGQEEQWNEVHRHQQ